MPAGFGGAGWLAITLETVVGTYLPPSTVGTIWVPILSEDLRYREDKYFSPQIRQKAIVSDAQQSFYHVEGDVRLEVDPLNWPYWMHIARHNIAKVTGPPIEYTYTDGSQGSQSTAASGNVMRTASITVVRNGIGFGYGGCSVGSVEMTVDNGVLMATLSIFGLSEATPVGLGTPTWVDPHLFGAAAHSVYVAASGTTPTFTTADTNFNGFTFRANFNPEARNNLTPSRAATYIRFGETEVTYTTDLDFVDKTEYDNMKNNTHRAVKFESLRGGATYALATEAISLVLNNTVYNEYPVSLAGMSDLVIATGVEGRALGIAGGDAYSMKVKTTASIT